MKFPASPKNLTPEEERPIREHWQWAGRYAMLWIIVGRRSTLWQGCHLSRARLALRCHNRKHDEFPRLWGRLLPGQSR